VLLAQPNGSNKSLKLSGLIKTSSPGSRGWNMTGERKSLKTINNREFLRKLFFHGIQSVMPEPLISKAVQRQGTHLIVGTRVFDLEGVNNLYLFGSGKAAIKMAKCVYPLVSDYLRGGVILNHEPKAIEGLQVFQCTHPSPSQTNIEATNQLVAQLSSLQADDFFIYLLSGGSSAMLEQPVSGISLDDLRTVTNLMLAGGLSIDRINLVRKQLSQVKGGKLASMTEAQGCVLVISDVIGDDLGVIGSGPFFPDNSTGEDAAKILHTAGLWNRLPENIVNVLGSGETMPGRIIRDPIYHHILGCNSTMLEAVQKAAQEYDIQAKILSRSLAGEAREVAVALVSIARNLQNDPLPFTLPLLLIFGGEMTVTLNGSGKGGRNQEFCLAALEQLADTSGITILTGGSDGKDGNSEATGGIIDATLYHSLLDNHLTLESFLANNDSYHGLKKIDGLIVSGPTGTNVADVTMIMIETDK